MPPLRPPSTVPAPPHMDTKPNVLDPRLGDFGLLLVDDIGFVQAASAVGTTRRQLGFQRLIDPVGSRTMGGIPIAAARLSSWLFGVGFASVARERRRLSLAGPQRLIQRPAQSFDFLFQRLDLTFQAGDLFGVGFLRQAPAYRVPVVRQVLEAPRCHPA